MLNRILSLTSSRHLLVILLLASIISCSKDEDNDPEPTDGERVIVRISFNEFPEGVGFATLPASDPTNFNNYSYLSFEPDPSGKITIDIRGKGGRSALGRYVGTTNLYNFKVQSDDTVIITDNGVVKKYLTSEGDGFNNSFTIGTGGIYDNPNLKESDGRARYEMKLSAMRDTTYR